MNFFKRFSPTILFVIISGFSLFLYWYCKDAGGSFLSVWFFSTAFNFAEMLFRFWRQKPEERNINNILGYTIFKSLTTIPLLWFIGFIIYNAGLKAIYLYGLL